jgi:hypothetical protein
MAYGIDSNEALATQGCSWKYLIRCELAEWGFQFKSGGFGPGRSQDDFNPLAGRLLIGLHLCDGGGRVKSGLHGHSKDFIGGVPSRTGTPGILAKSGLSEPEFRVDGLEEILPSPFIFMAKGLLFDSLPATEARVAGGSW